MHIPRPRPAGRRVLVTHPSTSLYGADRMLLLSLRGMLDAGLSPVLAVPGPGPMVDLATGWGVPVVVVPTPVLRKAALTLPGLLRLVAAAAVAVVRNTSVLRSVRPDVVYVSTLTTPLWVLLARCLGIPAVCHVHEAESGAPRLVQRALALPLLGASRLIVNSQFALAVLLRSAPHLNSRATVVLNGVDAPSSPGPGSPPSGRAARLLYVGRLSERKGVRVALSAVEDLTARGLDVHLDLVGDVHVDHAGFAASLAEHAARPGLVGRVTFHGFAEDVWPHLARCDVLLVPSVLAEPFGNTAVEGVLAARPVIASDIGGLSEALEGYRSARLVRPGDPAALADAVHQVLTDLPVVSAAASVDAAAAARRHAPSRYREAIAHHVVEAAR